jgi:SAM-dependent MidA family methyltransferase
LTVSIEDLLKQRIHECGPLTAAAFMELALYHPQAGYYSRVPSGDPPDNPDLVPVLGELLAVQLAEMAHHLGAGRSPFTLIDAGAGDGRLSHAILRGLRKADPHVCTHTHLHLIERSAAARDAQPAVLAAWTDQALGSSEMPDEFEGVIVARELLGAMPAHRVVMREDGLRELLVDVENGRLAEREDAPTTPALAAHLETAGVTLPPGGRADVSLDATAWMRDAAKRLVRGFLIVIDRGDDKGRRHTAADKPDAPREGLARVVASEAPTWLDRPGEQALTTPVDFTAIRRAAEDEGCVTLGLMDQTAFLMAVAGPRIESFDPGQRQAFTTLANPGGLGGATRVLVLGKNVGTPVLCGCGGR